jgi:3-carboxy-cis,cis-muconate cycloisomerase
MLAAVSDEAWVEAMVQVEVALATAEARLGVIPPAAAASIASSLRSAHLDVEQIGRDAVAAGNPVIPMVKMLTAIVPPDAAGYLHWGATSQDILDTAMMLVARRALALMVADADAVADTAAELARRYRSSLMPARTLMQQAVPTTFGLKAAGWLIAVMEARRGVLQVQREGLAVQFGGAAGTLAALGQRGLEVSRELALELDLLEPPLPWHASRGRVLGLATALGVLGAAAGKIALDVVLLAQDEVAELSEPPDGSRGGSSTLPQKRNSIGAVEALACVHGINAQVGLLMSAALHEHERAAGGWQAEWAAVSELCRLTAGAVSRTAEVLEGLQVHPDQMARNLAQGSGLLMSESVMMALAARIGRQHAHDLVGRAGAAAVSSGREFSTELKADPAISQQLSDAEIDAALDPGGYLGSAEALIDRAIAAYRSEIREKA